MASGALAAPVLTTIQDVLYKANGTRFHGTLTISWNSFQAADNSTIVKQTTTNRQRRQSHCVRVDGSTGPCGNTAPAFLDNESPAGIGDGSNALFTLRATPDPGRRQPDRLPEWHADEGQRRLHAERAQH